MSVKYCIYKNCSNYTIDHVSSGNFTLFQFPKDAERRKQWIALGQVTERLLTPSNQLMCSEHFDKKYFSINQRRTILVGAAVPYAYKQSDEAPNKRDEKAAHPVADDSVANTQQVQLSAMGQEGKPTEKKHAEGDEEMYDEDLESIDSIEQEDFQLDDDGKESNNVSLRDDFEDEDVIRVPVEVEFNVSDTLLSADDFGIRKRKMPASTIANEKRCKPPIVHNRKEVQQLQKGSVEKELASTTANRNNNKAGNEKQTTSREPSSSNVADEPVLIDANHVTTFIFKGEEYVQMPKQFYVHEKVTFAEQLKEYKAAIRTIRNCVAGID